MTSRAKGPGTVRSAVTLAGFGDTSSFPPSGWGVSEHRASFGFHLGEMLRGPREGHPEPRRAQRQAQPYAHPAHAPARTPSSRVPGTRHAHIASGFFKKSFCSSMIVGIPHSLITVSGGQQSG